MFTSWRRQLGVWAWLTPIGLILGVVAAGYVATNTPSTYLATRQVLFLSKPTSNPEVGYEVNPFLAFGASLYTAASVITISVTDERSTNEIIGPESLAEYKVSEQPGGSVPVLNIEATAPTPAEANQVADTVVSRIARVLAAEQKQAKAPKETWIVSSLIGSSLNPARVWKRNIVNGIAAAAGVVVLTLLALLFVIWVKQMWASRRRRRREQAAAVALSGTPDSPDTPKPTSEDPGDTSPVSSTADGEGAPATDHQTTGNDRLTPDVARSQLPVNLGSEDPEVTGEVDEAPESVAAGGPSRRAE